MQRLVDGAQIDDLLEPYRSVDRVRPGGGAWVLANMVGGLDGSASVGGRVGPLSAGTDSELFRLMRAIADVVVVGAQTVRAEGYGPVRLPEDVQAARVSAGRPPVPPVAVVSRSLAFDWSSPLFTEADPGSPTMVITGNPVGRAGASAAPATEIVVVGDASGVDAGVDPDTLLATLAGRGHQVVLCEGGPALLGQLVAAGRLDELCLTLAPVIGGDLLPVVTSPPGAALVSFSLRHVARDRDSLFLRYERGAE
jgi:riboflavin biosynthesis pyrimidine reductase